MLKNKNLYIIGLVATVNALGYAIIIPLLYSYSVRYGLSDFQNGLLFAVFSICQFFATPVIGRLSDAYGRKPLLVISLLGTALSFFLMAYAPNALWLFISRALDGITAGNVPVAMAVISDTTTVKDRAKGFGIISAAFNIGFIFGPVIAGLTVGLGTSIPFLIAGGMSLLAVIITWIYLPETNKDLGTITHEKLFDFQKIFSSLFDGAVGRTLLLTLFYFTAFTVFIYAFQSATVKVLHMDQTSLSLLFSLFGLIGFITQFYILQIVKKFLGVKKMLLYSLLAVAIIFAGMYFTYSVAIFIVLCIFLGVTNPLVQPVIQTILSEESDPHRQGEIQGINASYMSFGQIIGPIFAGILATNSILLPYVGASILCFICYFLAKEIFQELSKKHVDVV